MRGEEEYQLLETLNKFDMR